MQRSCVLASLPPLLFPMLLPPRWRLKLCCRAVGGRSVPPDHVAVPCAHGGGRGHQPQVGCWVLGVGHPTCAAGCDAALIEGKPQEAGVGWRSAGDFPPSATAAALHYAWPCGGGWRKPACWSACSLASVPCHDCCRCPAAAFCAATPPRRGTRRCSPSCGRGGWGGSWRLARAICPSGDCLC
jgi:hypothetical protein